MKKFIGNVLMIIGLIGFFYLVGLEAGMIPVPVFPAV